MRVLASLLVAFAVIAAVGATVAYMAATSPVDSGRIVHLEVAPGEPVPAIAARLEEHGVVRNRWLLLALARFEGNDRSIRHGEHVFTGPMTPAMVLDELARAPTAPTLTVTLQEGLTWQQMGELLAAAGFGPASAYRRAVCSPAFLAKAGAATDANCAEGYLFPDTYELVPGMSPRAVAELQLARFEEVIGPLLASRTGDNADVARNLGPHGTAERRGQVLTLASIVEKETGRGAERTLVSAVMHNRLRSGMRLQTDPTVIYGIVAAGRAWDGNITRAHLKEPTAYNTYTFAGLPPGPICNPGRAAIEAALAPETSPYLYFVARGDGSHQFSKTYAEHRRAVTRYQLRGG